MADPGPIVIDHAERFEHLARAPIAEAVIDLRARAEAPWEEADVTRRLRELLPEYPTFKRVSGVSFTAQLSLAPGEGEQSVAPLAATDHGWLGVRAESADGRLVAMFTRDGFSLSRLAPYQDWNTFR